jgi:hypothetical protein
VVHLLPTSTTDPKLQKKREELRQALLTGQTQAPIVNLGQASKKDPMELHLDPQGYQQVGDSIIQSYKPGVEKPVGTLVKPDWSKYKFGDQGTLEKIGPGQWRSDSGKIFSNAPELEVLPSVTRPESFIDKLQRTLPPALGGKGELVSQVFGDKKKSAATPTTSAAPVTPTVTDKQPAKDSDSGNLINKLFGIDQAKKVQSQWAADTERREAERKATADQKNAPGKNLSGVPADIDYSRNPAAAPKSKEKVDPAYEPGTAEYDERMEKLQTAAGDKWSREQAARNKEQNVKVGNAGKPADVTALLQKDQSGLTKAKRELSDFEQAFATARDRGEKEFTWQTKDGKPYQVTTRLKGETPSAKVSKSATVAPADTSLKQLMNKSLPVDQSLDTGEKIVDVPTITSTGDSNRFKAPSAEPEPPAPSEIKKAIQDFERQQDIKIATGQDTIFNEPKAQTDIELKEPTGEYIPPTDVDILDFTSKERQRAAADAELKESINTTSNADLHDILRLAGRLK